MQGSKTAKDSEKPPPVSQRDQRLRGRIIVLDAFPPTGRRPRTEVVSNFNELYDLARAKGQSAEIAE